MATLTNAVAVNNLSISFPPDYTLNQTVVKSAHILQATVTSIFTPGIQKQAAENFNWG